MSVSRVNAGDVDWVVDALELRREPLSRFAPVFWRPAPNAAASHKSYIHHLLSKGGARAYRTDRSVLLAAPHGEGWLVDDFHVPGSDWFSGEGRDLWNALDADAHGAKVRFVCPTYEHERAKFARAAALSVYESWWLVEFPEVEGGQAGAEVVLPGAKAITVAAPPIYHPGGPVLFVRSLEDPQGAPAALAAAVTEATRLGCPAVVVNQKPEEDALATALSDATFRRHCDYYVGEINPI